MAVILYMTLINIFSFEVALQKMELKMMEGTHSSINVDHC